MSFQNPKNKVPFPLQEIKIQKEVGEQFSEKYDVLSDDNEETNNIQLEEISADESDKIKRS